MEVGKNSYLSLLPFILSLKLTETFPLNDMIFIAARRSSKLSGRFLNSSVCMSHSHTRKLRGWFYSLQCRQPRREGARGGGGQVWIRVCGQET